MKQEKATEAAVEKVDKMANELNNEVLLAVRRATAHLRQKKEDTTVTDPAQIKDPNEKQTINTEFIKVLNTKASQDNLNVLAQSKANKNDLEEHMKTIDIIHRQLVHLNVLFVELIKQGIEVKNESKTERQQRAKFLLQQAISVLDWINEFDP
jgi:phosphoribosyl-dephospho-CoA transferase